MPVAETSVLDRTRPRPGKCLRVGATSAAREPRTNAAAYRPLALASPGTKSRWYCPTGAFPEPREVGTVSATGARLTLTPARRSSRAQARALLSRPVGPSVAWVRAEGMVL